MDEWGMGRGKWLYWGWELVSGIAAAGSFGMDLTGLVPSVPWQGIALAAFLAFALPMLLRIRFLESIINDRSPNVELVGLSVLEGGMTSRKPIIVDPKEGQITQQSMNYVEVRFANNPKHGTEMNHANNVRAVLAYFDSHGHRLHRDVNARWTASDKPQTKEDIARIIHRRIPSDGSDEPMKLISQPAGSGTWFIFNNDSYFFRDMVDESFQLPDCELKVQIWLRGERISKDFWVRISKDADGRIQVREEEPWLRRSPKPSRRATVARSD